MTFRVGQKIICVNDARWPLWARQQCTLPVKGVVYTIRSMWSFSKGTVIYLHEITNGLCCVNDDTGAIIEPGFPAARFRPIVERKTDITVFTEILRKASKPARAPVVTSPT